ncbi:MAG TPA: SulP family inorganic anion transporter [Candidatus Nanopelagicales bacterium]|nr:SulP family inorganic anion transporter [Candidatus Nanopelagicales bacterium]
MREPEPPSATEPGRSGRPEALVAAALPTISRLREYSPAWLRDDVVAGLTLSALLVPVGMGYAEAAGLPAIAGLYATIGALVAYFVVGPSRILVFGPDSALLPLVAAAVVPLAGGDPARAIALAAALAIMAGILCLGAAVARLGFVTDLLSRPIRVGYMNGIALTILVGQLPKLLGFSVSSNDVVGGMVGLGRGIVEGRTVPLALVIGGASLAVILGLRRVSHRIPGVLVAVVAAGVAVAVFGLASELTVVGQVPRGLPAIGIPAVSWSDLMTLFPAALGIALISFADTSVISHAFAARRGERVDADHEMAALGVVNVAAGLFGGFASSGSATRTPVAEAAGSRTQVTGLVGAGAVLLLLVAVPGLLAPVPTAALAAVVVSAAIMLFDLEGLRRLWRQRRSELVLALVAFLAVTLFGPLPGIAVAVGLSLLEFIRHAWRPHDAILGRVTQYKGYHDIERHPDARLVPGLILYRWDAPLFFANADLFRAHVLDTVDHAPPPVRWLAAAAEPVTDIDTTAADMLDELITELARRGVELHFAELKGHVRDRLGTYGILDRLGADHFHPTVGTVVKAYLARHPDVVWHDWEDEPVQPPGSVPDQPPDQPSAGGGVREGGPLRPAG